MFLPTPSLFEISASCLPYVGFPQSAIRQRGLVLSSSFHVLELLKPGVEIKLYVCRPSPAVKWAVWLRVAKGEFGDRTERDFKSWFEEVILIQTGLVLMKA